MSKRLFELGVIVAGLAATMAMGSATGCGNGGTGTTGSGGTGGTATTVSSSSSGHTVASSSSAVGPGGSGGAGGSGIHSVDGAMQINIDDPAVPGTLVDATTADWYSFTGAKGDRLYLAAVSPSQPTTPGDPSYTDLTLLLLGSDKMTTLTYQDDAFPRQDNDPQVFVQLPADGTYYLQVADCNGLFMSGCPNPASGVTVLDYELFVAHTSKLTTPEVLAGTAQDGTIAHAVPLPYAIPQGGTAGQYGSVILGGDFASATETDVFSFKPPTDATVAAGARARAQFFVQPIGNAYGDLSASYVKVWATDSTGAIIEAQADQSNYVISSTTFSDLEFSLPVTLGQQYYLFVQNTHTGGSATTDFYFIDHILNYFINEAELEGPTATGMNDTSATAETLKDQNNASLFVVDGNISAPGATGDVDWYKIVVPSGVTQYQVQCDAARTGSGLGGFTAELIGQDGTTSIVKQTEAIDKDFVTPAANVPAGNSTVYLKASAATQSATVTGTFYRCYVFFQ